MSEQISSYRLEEEIAHGGMGIVYRAVHTVFDEVVAIKAIFPELTLNPEMLERFQNEAKIQRRLQHPNIVQIREFLIEQGRFYIVMEFIEGETLTHRLRQLGRPMLPDEAIDIFRQALEGLGFAHSQGVIHRDIKPSNIMLTRKGVAKLTDFGIARALGSAKLTTTGTVRGTPAYMSPEQILGTKLDHRTDIYSMGIMLYEMLTGRVPFERPEDSDSEYPVVAAHVNQPPTLPSHWVPEIPPFLEAAILKALGKLPEERFASCQRFQDAIAPSDLPITRKVMVGPELKSARAIKPAHVPTPSPPGPEIHPAPKGLPPLPLGPQFRAFQEQKRSQVGIPSLVAALTVVIAVALAWVYWRTPAKSPDASPQETSVAAKPETPVPTPDVNNPPSNSPSPQPEQTSTPAKVETPVVPPYVNNPPTNLPSPQPAFGRIVVQTSPNAQVYLDDAFKGQASHQGRLLIADAKPGEHSVRISLEGKKDYEQPATITAGQVTEINATLADAEQPLPPAPVETPHPAVSVPEHVTADPNQARQFLIRQHTEQASQFLRNKRYADAESEFRAAIQLDPQNADLHIGLGITLGEQGNRDGQVAEDREAVRLSPNNEGAHVSLGIQLSQMGDWDGAIAAFTEVVRLNPKNYAAHYSLGVIYEHKGNQQAALQEYKTAYDLNPNIPAYKQAYERLLQQVNP